MKLYKVEQYTAQEWNDTERDIKENTVCVVRRNGAVCADIEATGTYIIPILKKLMATLEGAGLSNHAAFVSEFIEDITTNRERAMWEYSGKNDEVWTYSWGIENHDGTWYIFINVVDRDADEAAQTEPAQPNAYAMEIANAKTLDELDAIIERAANDESLTSAEYTALYNRALTVAQAWDARNN